MPDEPNLPSRSAGETESDALWEGIPLQLERDEQALGEDTVTGVAVRPVRPARPFADRLLDLWLLWTGGVGLTFAVGSLAAALLYGIAPAPWRGPLLAFEAAVIILVVRGMLAGGMRAGAVCRRFVGAAGLAVASAMILWTVLRSADRFIHGTPLAALLPNLFVFGVLGAAGCVVFVECLRDRSWAHRTVVLGTAAFVPLVALAAGASHELLSVGMGTLVERLRMQVPALVAAGVCGACLVVSLAALPERGRRSRLRWPVAGLWFVMLLGVVAFQGFLVARTFGLGAACRQLWAAAAAWCAAGLAALVLPGLVACWRRRDPSGGETRRATSFAWSLVAAGGLALLVLRLALGGWAHASEHLPLAAGVLALLVVAWLAVTCGGWTGRWAVPPMAMLMVATMCGLGGLLELGRDMSVRRVAVWSLGATYLWCLVLIGLALALWGALASRRRWRADHPQRALRDDVALLSTAGIVLGAAGLAGAFAMLLGRPAVRAAVAGTFGAFTDALRDAVLLAGGQAVWSPASSLVRTALAPWSADSLLVLVTGVSGLLLVLHVLARTGARWSLGVAAWLWVIALVVGSALCLFCATALFVPLPAPGIRTLVGRLAAAHFSVRLLVLIGAAGLLARLWVAAASALRVARRPDRWPLDDRRPYAARGGGHLAFLAGAGVILSSVVLLGALLLAGAPVVQAGLSEWADMARRTGMAAGGLLLGFGGAVRSRPEYAVAALAVAYVLVLVHEEARSGRPAAYPLVAAVWLALLAPLAAALAGELRAVVRAPTAARAVALAVMGLLLALPAWAALCLLARWWRLRRVGSLDEADQSPRAKRSRAAGRALGTLGILLTLIGCALVSHGALRGVPAYERHAARAAGAAVALADGAASGLAALRQAPPNARAVQAAGLAGAAAAVLLLILHVLARHRLFLLRCALYSLWFMLGAGGLVVLAIVQGGRPPGTWSVGQVIAALLVGAFVFRVAVALASPGRWLVRAPGR